MSDLKHSPKRKRSDTNNPAGPEATPKSTRGTPFNDQPLPFRLGTVPSLPPSEVSFPSSTGTSPSRRGRPKSPVKNYNSLQALDIPVDFVKLGDDGVNILPLDAHDLFERLQHINDKI